MAWKQNIIEDFKQLVSFDSISFHERKTADWLFARLKSMGFSVEEDQAGAYYGGDTGNIFAVLDGELEGDPVIFCAHMDVVEPGSGKKSVLEKDGTIHSAGDTVLGADDISGILEILYCVQLVLDSGKPHKKIEILCVKVIRCDSNFISGILQLAHILRRSECITWRREIACITPLNAPSVTLTNCPFSNFGTSTNETMTA